MGCSADAFLVWGIDLGPDDDHEGEVPWGTQYDEDNEEIGEVDFEDYFAAKLGVVAPTEEWSESEAVKRRYHEYWDAKRAAIKATGVSLKHYGYEGGSSALIITTAGIGADWSQAERVPNDALTVKPEWPEQMRRAMELLGITGEPGWLLLAEYG